MNQCEVNMYRHRTELMEYCKNDGILIESCLPAARGYKMERPDVVERAQR